MFSSLAGTVGSSRPNVPAPNNTGTANTKYPWRWRHWQILPYEALRAPDGGGSSMMPKMWPRNLRVRTKQKHRSYPKGFIMSDLGPPGLLKDGDKEAGA